MHVVAVVIAVLWIAFWAYWLVAAVTSKATQGPPISLIVRRLVVIVIVLALVRVGAFKDHYATIGNPWLEGVGTTLLVLGLGLAVWARIYLGRNWGTPMSQKMDPELITSGPYRYVRHPIYSGLILGGVGTTVAIGLYWLVPVVVFSGYFIYSASVEERNMERIFPEAYPEYRHRTKMLIPFVF